MSLIRWNRSSFADPFDELDRLQDELAKLFGFTGEQGGLFDRAFAPALDLIETADAFILKADLPGVDKKNLEVSLAANQLTIKGEKKDVEGRDQKKFFRNERWSGSFQRTITLPSSADPEKVSAELVDGSLKLTVGKREELKPRQIAVA